MTESPRPAGAANVDLLALQEQLEHERQRNSALEAELENLRASRERDRDQLRALRASRLWKLMAPFRRLSRIAR